MDKRKPYVIIQSQMTIQVTAGLQNEDVTNPDAHIPDRLKVNPMWPQATIIINEGQHTYPSEIVDWPTVKALQKDKILTIGTFVDDAEDAVKAKKTDLVENLAIINKDAVKEEPVEEKKSFKLSDIAGEN